MSLYQSICVVGSVGFLFYLGRVHLGRAMGIVLLHMCIRVCVLFDDSTLGL